MRKHSDLEHPMPEEFYHQAVHMRNLQQHLMVQGDPTQQDYNNLDDFVSGMKPMVHPDILKWRMGDAINKAKAQWGASKVTHKCAYRLGITVRWVDYLSAVSRTFDIEYRFLDVPWQLYREALAAPFPVPTLIWAVKLGLTTTQLKQRIKVNKEKSK